MWVKDPWTSARWDHCVCQKCGREFQGSVTDAERLGWVRGVRIDFRGGNGKVDSKETGTWTCSDCK